MDEAKEVPGVKSAFGRPPKPVEELKVRVNSNIDQKLLGKLNRYAERNEFTRSAAIERLLGIALSMSGIDK
jgi:hypothetical protein